jgi:hypothetical protein
MRGTGGSTFRFGLVFATAVMTIAMASGAGASLLDHEHYSGTDSYTQQMCGRTFSVVDSFSGQFALRMKGNQPIPYLTNNYRFRSVQRTGGDGFVIEARGIFKDLHITHVRGTIYRFVVIEAGRPFMVRSLDGDLIVKDRGLLKSTFMVDTKGDANLDNDEFVEGSFALLKDAGSHPGFYYDLAAFCDVVEEALAS